MGVVSLVTRILLALTATDGRKHRMDGIEVELVTAVAIHRHLPRADGRGPLVEQPAHKVRVLVAQEADGLLFPLRPPMLGALLVPQRCSHAAQLQKIATLRPTPGCP